MLCISDNASRSGKAISYAKERQITHMTKKHIYVLWGGWCSPQVFLATVPHFANWRNQPPHRNYVGGCNYMGLLMIVHIRCRMLHVFITFLICSPCRRYWRASRALSWAGAQSHGTTSLATTCRQQQQQPFKHKVSICSLPLWLCGSREQRLARPVLVQLGFWPQGLHQRWLQTFPAGPALPQGIIHL